MAKEKKRKPRRLTRGALCALFGMAAIVPTSLFIVSDQACNPADIPKDRNPATVYVFDQEAQEKNECADNFNKRWEDMLERYQRMMDDPAAAEAFRSYLSQFDEYKDAALITKAYLATADVNESLTYIRDKEQGLGRDNWQDPVTTVQTRLGDCEDHAILKYFVLRHLGVPVDRLFIATVHTDGGDRVNHAVLLVNLAPDAEKFDPTDGSNYVILDQGNSFNKSDDSAFSVFGLRNENGYWHPDAATKGTHADERAIATVTAPKGGISVLRSGPA